MNSAAPFNATLQVIATLLTFIAGYLALVLGTIVCLVAAELISEHASVVRAYGVRPVSLNAPLANGSKDATRGSTLALIRSQGR